MKINGTSIEFFQSIPDDLLIQIASNDWDALERLCIVLTLDVQLITEEIEHYLKKEDLAY